MTEKELLEHYYEQENERVFETSAGYRMDKARRGWEREWQEAKERAEILEDMIDRL